MPLTNQEIRQGETVKFVCDVVTSPGETDKVFIRWKFNEEIIKPSSSSKFNILEDGQTLMVQNAHKSEQGDYTCIASIRKMKDRSTARLIIKSRYNCHIKVRRCGMIANEITLHKKLIDTEINNYRSLYVWPST